MTDVLDAPGLRRSWRVRIRGSGPVEADVMRQTEACLIELERLGRPAFNVHTAQDDAPAAQAVLDVVGRLRALGATSGISHEPAEPPARLEFSLDRPQAPSA